MRFIFLSLFLFSSVASADLSQSIHLNGLAKTESSLSADNDDPMAIAAVRFLRALEKTLQTRYRYNLTLPEANLPILRLVAPTNPSPEAFDASVLTQIFKTFANDMNEVRAALDAIPRDGDIALELDLSQIWFDMDSNKARQAHESLFQAMRRNPNDEPMVVRFDRADLHWLRAYTHLLSAFSDLLVAFDPEIPYQTVHDSLVTLNELNNSTGEQHFMDVQYGDWVDRIALIYGAINKQPDKQFTKRARQHLLKTVESNKELWRLIELETDDNREWIPNPQQTSTIPLQIPAETGAAWQAVLQDFEMVLKGKKLIPHWRLASNAGINLAKLMDDMPEVDLVTWAQGSALTPFMEQGSRISNGNWRAFNRLVSGRGMLFSVFLN